VASWVGILQYLPWRITPHWMGGAVPDRRITVSAEGLPRSVVYKEGLAWLCVCAVSWDLEGGVDV